MKFLRMALMGAACLAMAGCVTAQDLATDISTVAQTTKDKITSVQSYALQVCKFVPTAATVVSIFSSGYGSSVAAVANAICNAVTTVPLADGPGDHKPRVNGIIVRGAFVR